jgi:hypothetical protein
MQPLEFNTSIDLRFNFTSHFGVALSMLKSTKKAFRHGNGLTKLFNYSPRSAMLVWVYILTQADYLLAKYLLSTPIIMQVKLLVRVCKLLL